MTICNDNLFNSTQSHICFVQILQSTVLYNNKVHCYSIIFRELFSKFVQNLKTPITERLKRFNSENEKMLNS